MALPLKILCSLEWRQVTYIFPPPLLEERILPVAFSE